MSCQGRSVLLTLIEERMAKAAAAETMHIGIGKGRTIFFFFLNRPQITGHEKVEKTDPYYHEGKLFWSADSLHSLVFSGAFSNISSLLSNYAHRCTRVDAV